VTSGIIQPKPTVNVYVDGFNLYYGALKNTQHRWLDPNALFVTLLPKYEVKRIRYFSARISGRAGTPRPRPGKVHTCGLFAPCQT
jgi:hypothetical protein